MNLKQFLLWLPMIVIAIANAGLREMVWDNYFDELTAHQISTATLILFCTVYIGLIFPFIGVRSFNHALLIGFLWVLLTVGFEFVFGFLVMSNSLKELIRSEEHTSELQSRPHLVCRLLLEKKKKNKIN